VPKDQVLVVIVEGVYVDGAARSLSDEPERALAKATEFDEKYRLERTGDASHDPRPRARKNGGISCRRELALDEVGVDGGVERSVGGEGGEGAGRAGASTRRRVPDSMLMVSGRRFFVSRQLARRA
jgi:hypothetical protein